MSGEVGANAFSSSDRDAIEREVDVCSERTGAVVDNIDTYFDLAQCARFIVNGGYSKVALQFPDSLLQHSAAAVAHLAGSVPDCRTFILADTSYGSCCVDEVAADHVAAEAIIHFGHACLSGVRRLPVLYAFGREPMDVSACVDSFRSSFAEQDSRVLLMCDTVYESHLDSLSASLQSSYQHLAVGRIAGQVRSHTDGSSASSSPSVFFRQPHAEASASAPGEDSSTERSSTNCTGNRHTRCGREFVLADGTSLSDYSLFYIGSADMALNNHLMTFSQCPFYLYDPRKVASGAQLQTAKASRSLKRRYVMMLKAKEARTVGLLAGTLGVADYMVGMRRLKKILKQAGKKVYTFSLGKLNVAKLANFPVIDVFVLVACPESTLISSEDFYKPVITPYELEVACNRSREWTGNYVTDFRLLFPGASYHVADDEEEEDEEPEFSLISGSLLHRPQDAKEESAAHDSQAVVKRSDGQVAVLGTGAAFLASRSWSGLDPQLGQTAVADEVVEGRTGVAMGYTHEPGFSSCAAPAVTTSSIGASAGVTGMSPSCQTQGEAAGGCCRGDAGKENSGCCS